MKVTILNSTQKSAFKSWMIKIVKLEQKERKNWSSWKKNSVNQNVKIWLRRVF